MKRFLTIQEERKTTREQIEANKKLIKALDYTEERQAAATAGHINTEEWHKYYKMAKANAGRIEEIKKKVFMLEIKARILKENANAAFISEKMEVLCGIMEKYNGKPYGEKTRAKIKEEAKRNGFTFYIKDRDEITIQEIDENGLTSPATYAAEAYAVTADNRRAYFLTEENKVNFTAEVIARPKAGKYTDNPEQAAQEAAEAIRHYQKTIQEAEAEREKLAKLIPAGLPTPRIIDDYFLNF